MATRSQRTTEKLTTAQQLGSLIKSARDIMRKDKGLSGDIDRLPALTWIMFLKFLDDMEQLHEGEAIMSKRRYRPILEPPYRWRDWAASPDGTTGDELIAFINQERAMRPDGTQGLGLFTYLRRLQSENGSDRRDVVANVFRGVVNRMINGYLIRDVINKINGIHFSSSQEIHTLGHLYESMLREMRDAAGDSGEFYTPRPIVRLMVGATDPKLGETILDPACGTGGFLTEAYDHLARQCDTVDDHRVLHEQSIYGQEAKPLPYLLAQMNLLLHGVEYPRIAYGNSLAQKITEIGDKERVDVILTNPPFGGEEEAGIKGNFPADMQTSETALLFLQLIMRKLRRRPKPGRAAIVVPNGTLSSPGVAARIREELLREFNVHTILRLPHNVFAPYTDIETNVVFFDRTGPTSEIFYVDLRLPPARTLSKSKPLRHEELDEVRAAMRERTASESSWFVARSALSADVNLDIRNPTRPLRGGTDPLPFLARIEAAAEGARADVAEVRAQLDVIAQIAAAPRRRLSTVTNESNERLGTTPALRLLGVSSAAGFTHHKTAIGKRPETYKVVRRGYLAYNPMRINIGSIAVATHEDETGIVSPDYVVFRCSDEVTPEYVYHYLKSDAGLHQIHQKTRGSVRSRLYYEHLAAIEIPVPPERHVQDAFVRLCEAINGVTVQASEALSTSEELLGLVRRQAFHE